MRSKIIFACLMLLMQAVQTQAQNTATVKGFTITTDALGAADRRNDLNGTPCALVKVQVLDEIDRIEGNKIGSIINRGVEKWVYMCKGSTRMTVHLKNHLPVKVLFKNYSISRLESNRIYELVIETPDKPKPARAAEVKGNNLQLLVKPAHASVTIWGDNLAKQVYKPQDDGTLSVYVPYGRYHYEATAEGYHDRSGEVFVTDENRWENVDMQVVMGALIVECNTKNVNVFINGEKLEKNKAQNFWSVQLAPGRYDIEGVKSNYVSVTKTVDVVANQTAYVVLNNFVSLAEQRKNIIGQKRQKEKAEKANKAKKSEKAAPLQEFQPGSQGEPQMDIAIVDKPSEDIPQTDDQIANQKSGNKQSAKKLLPIKRHQNRGERETASDTMSSKHKEKAPKKEDNANQKRFTFGVRGGLNLATANYDDYDGEAGLVGALHLGVNADLRLLKKFHLNAALLLSQKGYTYETYFDRWAEEKVTAHYIELPIQLGYQIGSFQIKAGSYVAMGVGGDIKIEGSNINSNYTMSTFDWFTPFDCGLIFGATVQIGKNFVVGTDFEFGLLDYPNSNIAISLGYNF